MRTFVSSLRAIGAIALGASMVTGCASVDPQAARYPEPPARGQLTTGAAASSNEEASPTVDGQDEPGAFLGNPNAPEVAVGVDPDVDVGYADNDPSALSEFREPLAPYGAWVEDASYGTVWVPSRTAVGEDFVPYQTAGHWSYDGGYVWVSDYDWGYVPFHYGRWVMVGGRGWAWIPGRTYSGAWVVWRTGPAGYGYVGWAPASPTWYWSSGVAVGLWYSPTPYWAYCPSHHVFYPPAQRQMVVAGPQRSTIEAGTKPWTPPPRTVAQPTVAGAGAAPGRTFASPTAGVGARKVARPAAGPDPTDLGIAMKDVPRVPENHAGIERATRLAQPSGGANPAGARVASSGFASQPAPSFSSRAAAAPSFTHNGVLVPRTPQPTPFYRAPRQGEFVRPSPQAPMAPSEARSSTAPQFSAQQPAAPRPFFTAPQRTAPSPSPPSPSPLGGTRGPATPPSFTAPRSAPMPAPSPAPRVAPTPRFSAPPRAAAPTISRPSAPISRPSAPSRPSSPSRSAPPRRR